MAVHHSPSLPCRMDMPLPSVADFVFPKDRGPVEVTFGGSPATALSVPVVPVRLPSCKCTCACGYVGTRFIPATPSSPGPSTAVSDVWSGGSGRCHTVDPGRSPVPVLSFPTSTVSDRECLWSCRSPCASAPVSSPPMPLPMAPLPPSHGCDDEPTCNNLGPPYDA